MTGLIVLELLVISISALKVLATGWLSHCIPEAVTTVTGLGRLPLHEVKKSGGKLHHYHTANMCASRAINNIVLTVNYVRHEDGNHGIEA
jgi:hypothetical protein